MPKIDQEQIVQTFSKGKETSLQEVHIDPEDPDGVWITVTHDGNEMTMSLVNWNNLFELVESAIKKI